MRSKIGNIARLKHILDAIHQIEEYTFGKNIINFANNSMMIFACIKQLEIIGEASNHLTDDLKAEYDTVEWREIVEMRNVFVHEYFGIDVNLVWDIISNDLQHLKQTVTIMLEEINFEDK